MPLGKVTLVGAGPGAVDLITVRGMRAIQSADIILYDALSGDDMLAYASDDAELIYVGKRCGQHSLKQPDINALLFQSVSRGKQVVRLKGGDPFIFGRGHEELAFLQNRNVEVEIIPGISSSTSLPLLQNVPLTRRRIAESFWVLTGTTKQHELSGDIEIAARTSATLVILMGMRKLGEIATILARVGKQTVPVMVIQNGSRDDQKVVLGTAQDIVAKVQEAGVGAPGIIVIGEVVGLHPALVQEEVTVNYQ